jgi:Ser/Thr protein kinase RdoA (MazF antagonist)
MRYGFAMTLPVEASFYDLGPEQVLQAVEHLGFECDGYQLTLNSYENRVYQIGLADEESVIAKFYRPNRWSDAAILEEHEFTLELHALDIPVVPPLLLDGQSLFRFNSFRFSLYPLRAGRAPDLENSRHLEQLGRFIGRIHALGATRSFIHRPTLNVQTFGDAAYEFLLENGFIPVELETAYETLAEELLHTVEQTFDRIRPYHIRLHGDGHPGNILLKNGTPFMVDFDDARMGPAIQDLWMFLSGDRGHMESGLDSLLTAYTQFYGFDTRELALIEPLRTLRMMHHAAWLARRWDDPAFKRAFPWFNTQNYWENHILSLKEQASVLQETPIQWI